MSVMSNHLRSSVVASPAETSHRPANLELSQIAMIRRVYVAGSVMSWVEDVLLIESGREAKDGMKANPELCAIANDWLCIP